MSYFEAYAEPTVPEQAAPERPTDVPIVVPSPPIDATFPCCPGCEVLNEPVTELVPIEEEHCERASCYARANLPRTVPKSYWSWPVAICKGSIPTCTVVSPNTEEVHVPRRLYACLVKTEVPD